MSKHDDTIGLVREQLAFTTPSELLLHLLAVLQLLPQLAHRLVLLQRVHVGTSPRVARREVLPSVEFFHFIIESHVPSQVNRLLSPVCHGKVGSEEREM